MMVRGEGKCCVGQGSRLNWSVLIWKIVYPAERAATSREICCCAFYEKALKRQFTLSAAWLSLPSEAKIRLYLLVSRLLGKKMAVTE